MSVHQKLLNVQSEIKVPKNQFNKFGGYQYRSCEDILEAAKPLLKKNSCILSISDEIKHIEGRFYVEARVMITDCESGDSFQVTAYAREEESKKGMDSSQLTGSTSSYARKYALNGLFCLDDNKDSDDTNKHGKNGDNKTTTDKPKETPKQETPAKTTSEPQQRKVFGLMKQKGLSDQETLDIIFGLFPEKPWNEHMNAYGEEGKDFTTGSALKHLLIPEASKLIEDLSKYTDAEGK